jgi:hypothetical protein
VTARAGYQIKTLPGQGLAGVTQVVEPEARYSCLTTSAIECLAYRIAAHRAAVAADEHAI